MNDVKNDYLAMVKKQIDSSAYRELHWEGTFTDYLEKVRQNPSIIRNAFQRLYDMIISYGVNEMGDPKDNLVRFRFFDDVLGEGRDAIFGLTQALMHLVSNLKSASYGYGVEKRVMLLHGPVGSSKSTIVRLLKRGLEKYSTTEEGQLYTFGWKMDDDDDWHYCPMNEEPLRLIPIEARSKILEDLKFAVMKGELFEELFEFKKERLLALKKELKKAV